VEPGVSGKNWKITIQQDGVKLNTMYSFKVGEELPDWVQIWSPPCEDADMVLLSTHADDEILFFAGTLPTYAGELKMAVQVVYLTNHWADAPYRVHELLNGLWTCGVRNYPVIGPFPDLYSMYSLDHAKTLYDTEAIKEFQTWVLRRFKPEVLLGHDINGEYGHSVHMLNTAMLIEAVALANDETYMPEDVEKYGVWDVPKFYIHLYEENRLTFRWDDPLSAFDGKTGYEVAVEAYQCHASQVHYNPEILRDDSNMSCLYFGLYRSTVGEDTKKDSFFENITTFSDDVPVEPEVPVPEEGENTESEPSTEGTEMQDVPQEGITEVEDNETPQNPIGTFLAVVATLAVAVIEAIYLTRKKEKGE
jgi:LmbE family N-acetylglucosaminyl deacetylase